MGWESSGVVGFDLGPLLEGQMRTAKLKSAYNLLIIGPRGFGALSLRWIQFASVFRCARSSFAVTFFISRKRYLIGEVLKHIFFRNPGIAKVLAVERDVKPQNMNFAKVDRREGGD